MDEDQQLAKEAARGAKARAMLEAAIFQEVMQAVEDATLAKWKASPIRDHEGQLALRLKWQIIQEIRGYLADVAETGKLAERQIVEKQTIAERLKGFMRR
jgi:hypothetical protein